MARIVIIQGVPAFYCLACKAIHKADTRFLFNYNHDKPTFRQEIRLRVGPFAEGHVHAGKFLECHSRIRNGEIAYSPSSTHEYAGKTVGLPDFAEIAAQRKAEAEAKA